MTKAIINFVMTTYKDMAHGEHEYKATCNSVSDLDWFISQQDESCSIAFVRSIECGDKKFKKTIENKLSMWTGRKIYLSYNNDECLRNNISNRLEYYTVSIRCDNEWLLCELMENMKLSGLGTASGVKEEVYAGKKSTVMYADDFSLDVFSANSLDFGNKKEWMGSVTSFVKEFKKSL